MREYKGDKGNQLEGSISEKIKIDINGAQNGLFINGKNLDNPVLLFVSSGPGTDDYFLNEKYPDMHIEDEFTVCYWDYRGMGIVYDKNIDDEIIVQANKDNIPSNAISIMQPELELYIPFEDLVDIAAEKERLQNEKTKLEAEVERAKKMLSNPGFVSKAPESKINEEKEKLAKYEEMLKNTEERLKNM